MTKDFLIQLSKILRKRGALDQEVVEIINRNFHNNSDKVLETLNRGITLYEYKPSNRQVWTALGEEKEHIIYPRIYCSCIDFYKEVVINRKRAFCKHILAQLISEELNNFKRINLEDDEFKFRLEEMKLDL